MAYRTYKDSLAYDETTARLKFDDSYLIRNLLNQHDHAEATGSSIIDYIEPFSPVDELVKSSKIVRTGKNGVPSKVAFRKDHRNVHKTYIGNVAAHSTTESTDVGLVNFHTLGASISKEFGLYGHKPDNFNPNHWDSVSIDEALVPFQNSMDSGRLIIARTHMTQKIPIIDAQPPLVQSGAEFIVPKLTSPKFGHVAKQDGKVIKVKENRFVHVEYKDGSKEVFDILPRYSTTKRNSIIRITLDNLQVGDQFKQGDLVAWSKSFVDNTLAIGKNNCIAVINYLGRSHEDGYVVTQKMSESFRSEMVKKVPVIVPPHAKLLKIAKINDMTELNDVLIEFQNPTNINVEEYMDQLDLYDDSSDVEPPDMDRFYQSVSQSMKVSSPGGEIVDIKIRLNNKSHTDVVLLDLWKQQFNTVEEVSNAVGKELLDNIDTSVLKVGHHKLKGVLFEGCLVEFYIKTEKPANIGDKIANRFGAKGVINHIIPEDKSPKGEHSGEIDVFLAPAAILGRKNTVILKELYLGKLLHNLKSIVQKDLENNNFEKTKTTLLYFYNTLDRTGHHGKSIEDLTEEQLKKKLSNPKFNFNIIVPPFGNITFRDIKSVANKLKIPLDEKIFIPELNMWTKTPVPVGYSYMSTMEQLASDYESTRSRAGYTSATGQPLKRKSRMGGQSLGNLDIYNLLTYDAKSMMTELMTARSDNMKAKHEIISNITRTGETNLPQSIKKGRTQDLFKVLMLSIGLDIRGKF